MNLQNIVPGADAAFRAPRPSSLFMRFFSTRALPRVRKFVACLLPLMALVTPAEAFVHPGLYHTASDLASLKTKALGTAEPWKTSYSLFLQFSPSAGYTPSPVPNATIGTGQFQIRADARAAYDLALKWYINGDTACRDTAINIINAWSYTMVTYDPVDNLSASEAARGFAAAGEILIHGNSGWSAADIAQCKSMMLNLLYPALSETKIAGMKGNQGTDAMAGLMAIAVFCDDQAKFDYVVDAYKNHPNCAVTAYISSTGQSGEHGRDQAHPMGGMMALDNIARMARCQNIDLYGWAGNRLLAGFEYWCKYNLGNDDVPFAPFGVYDYTGPSQIDRGRLAFVNFEAVYDAYITQRGLTSPYLVQAASRVRPDPWGVGALRFYNGPSITLTQLIPNGTNSIISRLNNLAVSVAGDSTVNSAQLNMELYSVRPSQRWTFTHLGMNIYSMANAQNKAADIPGSSSDVGVKVQIYSPNAGPQQRWRAVPNGDGTLSFLNLNSSFGMTISGDAPGTGGLLIQDTIFSSPDLGQKWTVGAPSSAVPAAPAGVNSISRGTNEVILSFTPGALAYGYNIKRATSAGGPYTTIATGLTTSSYTDTTGIAGQVYFYVVSAINQNGESANSSPVEAIAGLPAPWASVSVGSATGDIQCQTAINNYSVSGSGNDISGTADSFHFLNQLMRGDGTLIARASSSSFPGGLAKIGLMMRETAANNSKMVFLMVDSGVSKTLRMAYRSTAGGSLGYTGSGPSNTNGGVWMKIQRAGNTFTTAYSPDGLTWTTVGTINITMNANLSVGIAVCSRSASQVTMAFDNVQTPLLAGYQGANVGTVGTAGDFSYDYSTNTYTVKGAGGDIAGSADNLGYLWRGISGDGILIGRLASAAYPSGMGKIGLMIRETNANNSKMVFVMHDRGASNSLRMASRATTGGSLVYTGSSPVGVVIPQWLKIERSGNVFTTSYSATATSWTVLGSVTITMTSNVQIGMAVCSRSSSLATADFDNVSLDSVPSPWQTGDVGAAGVAGSAITVDGIHTIVGSGADIWGTADALHEVDQISTGDCDITARVVDLVGVNASAKAGLMIRESLAANSVHATVSVTPAGVIEFIRRNSTGGTSVVTSVSGVSAPVWVRLVRSGNSFTASYSVNGTTWNAIGTDSFAMNASGFIGLITTSHIAGKATTAVIDSLSVTP